MNSNKSIKVLLAIPAVIFVVGACCLLLATLLEQPTGRGGLYTALMMISLLCMFLAPLPCLVISGVGTIKALTARRANVLQPTWLLALGVVETIVSLLGMGFAMLLFMGAQSV